MKKIIFLLVLAFVAFSGYSQCIRTYSLTPVASENTGFVQQVQTCAWTSSDFATVTDLLVGSSYTFTCSSASGQNYITLTDEQNNVIEEGPSPLTISEVTAPTLRLHLSDNGSCEGSAGCHTVTMQLALACPFPTGLAIENLSTASATFIWEPAGSETTWEVIALTETSAPPTIDLTDGVNTVNVTEFEAQLQPATTYKFYIRAVCSATAKSPWNVSAAFTTLCEPVTYFSEGFDNSTTLPNCFAKVGVDGTVNVQNQSTAASLPNNLYLSSGGTVALPSVSNFADVTHRIKFKLRGGYGAGGIVKFGYLTNPADAASFIGIQDFVASSSTVYDEIIFEPANELETGNLAFKHVDIDFNSVVIDDVIWEPIPECADITLLKIDAFTSNSASLSWTSAVGNFEVVYGLAATSSNPNNLTPQTVQQNSVSLSDLQSSTAYKVWVRSVCANNVSGAWIGPRTVTTTCAPVSTFSENFNATSQLPACFKHVGNGGNAYVESSSIYLSSYEDGNAGNVMSYGIVSLPAVSNAAAGTHRLKFKMKSSGSIGGIIQLGYLTNPDDAASFTAVQSFTSTSTTEQAVIYIPQAGAITAQVMAFRHTGTPSYGVLIDDLIWETAPNCADVSAIQVTEISNASATITWMGTTETNWEVAYGASSLTDPNLAMPIAVSQNPEVVLNNLDASAGYKVWVRSNCNAMGFGAWIGPVEFSTSCDAVSDFSQNFDLSSNLPNCWAGYGGLFMQSGDAATEPNSVYMMSLNVLGTVPVSNASAGTHRLKFKGKAMYGLGGAIEVGYMTSYNNPGSFVSLQTFTPTSTANYDQFYANLGSSPTTGYLALRHSGASFNAVAIDEVVWEPLPLCEDVSTLTNVFVSHNSAAVSWTAEYSDEWEIVYTESASESVPADLSAQTASEASFIITDLISNTAYKYWVRSICSNDQFGAWIGPKEFMTTCDPIENLPWSESFDANAAPDVPECWTKVNGNWIIVDQSQAVSAPFVPTKAKSGDNYLRVYNGAVNNYMWTPGFNLQANVAYNFSTFVQGDGYDGWKVEILSNTAPQILGAIQLGESYDIPAGTLGEQLYTEMKRGFTPAVSGTYFFAVRVNENSAANPYYIAFDDFSVEENNLSTPGFDFSSLKVYPNPASTILNISYTSEISSVAVFNLLGQQVFVKMLGANSSQIDISALSAGTYLAKITSGNQTKTIKVVKE